MSPSCCVNKLKQSFDGQKSKSLRNKRKSTVKESITTTTMREQNDDSIYIELDLKCSCPHSLLNNNASIQFTRRYLHCQSAMPLAILRSYIQLVLPHSSMTQVTFYDAHDRLLHDSALLSSLHPTSSLHIPVRFSLLNTITSLAHCSCSSPPSTRHLTSSHLSSPAIIKRETIDQTLSTCSPTIYSPCVSSSPPSSSIAMSIVNLLTPPSCVADSSDVISDRAMIDEITSQFGEICPPVAKTEKRKAKSGSRVSKKSMCSSSVPLDLSVKKRPSASSFDIFSSQLKWIKT